MKSHGKTVCRSSGAVLEDLLSSIGLERTSIFITSIIKCRPPETGFRGGMKLLPVQDISNADRPGLSRNYHPMGRLASDRFLPLRIPHDPSAVSWEAIPHRNTPWQLVIIRSIIPLP